MILLKKLVLAEKPSVGREIAKVLKCNNNKGSYIEGKDYVITWALGHLVELQSPEDYDNKLKTWSMETLPMLPKHMKLKVIKKTTKQFYEVKKQMERKDIDEIIIATDAGREGELVARWIIEKAHVKKPIKRLWISSQTDKAILDGFKNLKPGENFFLLLSFILIIFPLFFSFKLETTFSLKSFLNILELLSLFIHVKLHLSVSIKIVLYSFGLKFLISSSL